MTFWYGMNSTGLLGLSPKYLFWGARLLKMWILVLMLCLFSLQLEWQGSHPRTQGLSHGKLQGISEPRERDAWRPVFNPHYLLAPIMLNILIIIYEDDMIFSKLWFSERGFWYCGKSPGQVNMSLGSQSQSYPFLDKSFTIAGPHCSYLRKNMDKITLEFLLVLKSCSFILDPRKIQMRIYCSTFYC